MSNIRKTMLAQAPKFAADYFDYVKRYYNNHVEEFGNKWVRNSTYNSTAKHWNFIVYPCLVRAPGESEYAPHPERVFSEEKLQEIADRYGKEMALEWANKVEEKLAEVEGVEFDGSTNGSFRFYGTRNGHNIRLEQQTVTKVSKNGHWYHQFPARIYVDNQFTPAAAYKKLFND